VEAAQQWQHWPSSDSKPASQPASQPGSQAASVILYCDFSISVIN